MAAEAMSVKDVPRNYIIEFSIVMLLYVGAVWARPWLITHAGSGALALAAKLAPIVPVWLMLVVVWRYYLRVDELQQKRLLETVAISFGVASCIMVSYAFLTDLGLPSLAITWAWPTLGATWLFVGAIRGLVER